MKLLKSETIGALEADTELVKLVNPGESIIFYDSDWALWRDLQENKFTQVLTSLPIKSNWLAHLEMKLGGFIRLPELWYGRLPGRKLVTGVNLFFCSHHNYLIGRCPDPVKTQTPCNNEVEATRLALDEENAGVIGPRWVLDEFGFRPIRQVRDSKPTFYQRMETICHL